MSAVFSSVPRYLKAKCKPFLEAKLRLVQPLRLTQARSPAARGTHGFGAAAGRIGWCAVLLDSEASSSRCRSS